MDIGGNAFHNGVNFVSGRYRARVEATASGYTVRLSARLAGKRAGLNKLLAALRRVPLARGPVALAQTSRLLLLLMAAALAFDAVPLFCGGLAAESAAPIEGAALLCYFLFIAAVALYLLRKILRSGGSTRQFHGAEHKVLRTYASGEPLTLENVRRASRVEKRCGTEFVVFALVFYGILSLLPGLPEGLLLLLSFSLGYEVFRLKNGDRLPVIRLLFRLGYFLQKRLFTAEPTDAQLLAVIAAAEAVLQAEKSSLKIKEKKGDLN